MTPVRIGECELYCGDAREIVPALDGYDVLLTDPPYGVGLTRKSNDFRDSKFFDDGASLQASSLYCDDPDYVESLIEAVIKPALAKAKRGAIFPGTRMMFSYPRPSSVGTVFMPNGAGYDAWGFGCNFPILYYGRCPYMASGRGCRPNSFRDEQPGERGIDHPCPKPLKWMLWTVNRVSLAGETILDPFFGSGTCAVACARLGRSFLGVEENQQYFDDACERIEKAYRQRDLFIEEPKPKPAIQASLEGIGP